jgi:hypothetical protein
LTPSTREKNVPKIFDLFGLGCDDLAEARRPVERVSPVTFQSHESLYWGGDYFAARSPRVGEITIRHDFNAFTGELTEPKFPDMPILVSVSEPPEPDGLKQSLLSAGPEVRFLRSDEV